MSRYFCKTLLSVALAQATVAGAQQQTMKAAQFAEFGPSSVLKVAELPRPHPAADEVVVRVFAAGVNSIDWTARSGQDHIPESRLPIVPGHDIAGDIVEVGAGVAGHHVGDHVFAMMPLRSSGGGYAEYAKVDASLIAARPRNIDAVSAAAVPLAALTAYQAVFDAGGVRAGQTVLIHGGSGGVGHFAVQFAKHAGAKVIATSSAANLDFLRSLGAERVIDYRARKFEDEVKDVDVVIDTVGGETLKRSYGVLRRGGTLITLNGKPDAQELDARGLHGQWVLVHSEAAELATIAKLIESGAVKPQVSAVFPLGEAGKAQDQNETGHTRGKVVIRVADEEHAP